MRLQLNLEQAVEVRDLGTLALVGTCYTGRATFVTFLLSFRIDAALCLYLNLRAGLDPKSLLYAILVGEGCKIVEANDDSAQRLLFFNYEVEGRVRSPMGLLNHVAAKLRREVRDIEDMELSILEDNDRMEWAEHAWIHPGRRGPMPDFRLPRTEE